MAALSLGKTHELTLHVESPVLDNRTKSATSKTAACGYDSSYWTVTLTLSGQSLIVRVDWYRNNNSYYYHIPEDNTYAYHFMHIVPHGDGEDIVMTSINLPGTHTGTYSASGSILASKVLFENKYRFDVVISTGEALAHHPMPKEPPPVVPPPDPPSSVASSSSRRDMLLSLLKDVHSVDICFVFTSEKTYPKVGLWAHRAILSRHKVFEKLIQEAAKGLKTTNGPEATKISTSNVDQEDAYSANSSTSSSSAKEESSDLPSILTIQVDKFSLATMCSVLYFIYVGEVQTSIVPSQFAISRPESVLVLYDTRRRTRESVRWDPMSADSDWKLSDVTWPELGFAAEFYGLGELGTLCEKQIAGFLNNSNAIDVLFNIGCHSEKVKKQAVDYIAEHMGSLFVGGGNPFESFRDHPACHDMMVEVFRVKATKRA